MLLRVLFLTISTSFAYKICLFNATDVLSRLQTMAETSAAVNGYLRVEVMNPNEKEMRQHGLLLHCRLHLIPYRTKMLYIILKSIFHSARKWFELRQLRNMDWVHSCSG